MILPRLRTATAAIHQELEDRLDLEEHLESPASYRLLLERFWGLHAALEPRLDAVVSGEKWALDWEHRGKVRLLARDLQALGCSALERAVLPLCEQVPAVPSPARALGVLYVLEGSTLGGQVISKMIVQKLGLGADTGAAYFNGYGALTGSMWKRFGTVMTAAITTPEQEEEAIAAAGETFACFQDWLCPQRAAV